jgi:DNA-binding response OmpR family regulator
VLVAEDNHILATILADHLAAQGHDVVPTHGGRPASLFCQQQDFDAIVVDLVMPDIYGIELLEELHAKGRMPHAILITGFRELLEEVSPRLATIGVEAVIEKPFMFSELDHALARVN